MKVYIAGKITGLEDYKEYFDKKEKELIADGFKVINPAIMPGGFEQDEYMHICYAMIDVCNAVYFLSNWKDSKGAKLEQEYAESKGKIQMFQREDV